MYAYGSLDDGFVPRDSPDGANRSRWFRALTDITRNVGDVIVKTAASAQELIHDRDLRRKGAQFMQSEAQRALQNLQIGVERAADGLGQRLQLGASSLSRNTNITQLKSLLTTIDRKIQDYQREKALRETRKQPVDVQVGLDLYENMPQEFRTRLWTVLLESPHLVKPLQPLQNTTGVPQPRHSHGHVRMQDLLQGAASLRAQEASYHRAAQSPLAPNSASRNADPLADPFADVNPRRSLEQQRQAGDLSRSDSLSLSDPMSPQHPVGGIPPLSATAFLTAVWTDLDTPATTASPLPPLKSTRAAAAVGCTSSSTGSGTAAPYATTAVRRTSHPGNSTSGSSSAFGPSAALSPAPTYGPSAAPYAPPGSQARARVTQSSHQLNLGSGEDLFLGNSSTPPPSRQSLRPATSLRPAPSHQRTISEGGAVDFIDARFNDPSYRRHSGGGSGQRQPFPALPVEDEVIGLWPERSTGSPAANSTCRQASSRRDRMGRENSGALARINSDEEWEVVADTPAALTPSRPSLDCAATLRLILDQLQSRMWQRASVAEEADIQQLLAKQAIFSCMLKVVLPTSDEAVPLMYPPECRFASLNEMTAGQEEVDDVINRDINRTFPEHPFFSLADGQQALFRVLKAYSLHDIEVGYCQGMAFAAGVLLMYLPQETAFRLFCRLMDPDGPNLRRMYLPGLDALKAELSRFEYLVARFMPPLYAHLQAFGVPAVLYTSQWLMTAFATPFPPSFCARLVDIMLQDNNDLILMRVSLAVMEEVQEELLQLHDFEAIITHLKVQPLQWDGAQLRKVLDRGLNSNISDADLANASQAVAAELAKLAVLEATGAAAGSSGAVARAAAEHKAATRQKLAANTLTRFGDDAAGGCGSGGAAASPLSDPPPQWIGGASAWGLGGSGSALAVDLNLACGQVAGAGADAAAASGSSRGASSSSVPTARLLPLDLESEYMDMILELDLLPVGSADPASVAVGGEEEEDRVIAAGAAELLPQGWADVAHG